MSTKILNFIHAKTTLAEEKKTILPWQSTIMKSIKSNEPYFI